MSAPLLTWLRYRLSATEGQCVLSEPSAPICTVWRIGLRKWVSPPSPWESTGVYWIPVFEILEAHGFEVLLVNARDVRNVPGRKTDVNDAQWLQQLHQHGLVRGSFRPRDGVVRLRAYLRHRERLVDYAASHIQHMQKALMQMNVQLQHVVTDITGLTGMRIIRAIVSGNHAPEQLAEFRDRRCHASEDTIREALIGNYRPEHVRSEA